MTPRSALVLLGALFGFSCGSEYRDTPSRSRPVPAAEPAPAAKPAPATEPEPATASPERPAPSADSIGMRGSPLTQAQLITRLQRAELLSFKPIGSTSTVFRTRLSSSPGEAALKAATRDRPLGPLAEIGAAAVARCLGIDTVPPAVARSVPIELLRKKLEVGEWAEIAPRLLPAKHGRVPGALIYWIPDLRDVGLNKAEGLARARQWLRVGGALPEAEMSLARSVSVMLCFDYIIGNFDRWSGSNTKGNAAASSVYVRDHDLALPAKLSEPLRERLASQMALAERVSRALYTHAHGLSRECIGREVARAYPEDAGAHDPLSPRMVDGIFDRRDGFLSHVDALRARYGDDAILFFE